MDFKKLELMDMELKLMEGLDVEVLRFSALRGHFRVRGIASGGGLHLAKGNLHTETRNPVEKGQKRRRLTQSRPLVPNWEPTMCKSW